VRWFVSTPDNQSCEVFKGGVPVVIVGVTLVAPAFCTAYQNLSIVASYDVQRCRSTLVV